MSVETINIFLNDPTLSRQEIQSRLDEIDHFEIARRFHEFSQEDKIRIFHLLESDIKRQELLYETDRDSRLEILQSLDPDYLAKLLGDMPEDEATDLLMEHPEETRDEILEKIPLREANVIKDLISYGEETAGGLMETSFHGVYEEQTAADILMQLKRNRGQEAAPYFYVLSRKKELLGYFKLLDLLNVPAIAHPTEFMRKETPKVLLTDPCDKVANMMDHEHLSSIPVVNEKNVIQGVVTFDDVIRSIQDIASEDIFTMVGTAKMDPFARKIGKKIWTRAPWLFTTFLGGLFSAFIMSSYQHSLVEFSTIILFIPFVIGLSGNVAIQGATVIVRGMATGDIQEDNLKRVVRSELAVGCINGLIFGVLCGVVLTASSRTLIQISPLLGLTVGLGIIMAVSLSSLLGSLTPIFFLKAGIDPAISTGPMVIVLNDILGLTIYLATASVFFSLV
ncbi:MAG: magnesium transporter [Nitrospinae bacterium]|jgi:magnesium transporter|nr:magnesium transporter [Nitrospinota bacterium]